MKLIYLLLIIGIYLALDVLSFSNFKTSEEKSLSNNFSNGLELQNRSKRGLWSWIKSKFTGKKKKVKKAKPATIQQTPAPILENKPENSEHGSANNDTEQAELPEEPPNAENEVASNPEEPQPNEQSE